MMNEQVIKKMREMKFYGMVRAFEATLESDRLNDLTKDEMIAHLVQEEWDDRCNRKIARNMRNARFHYKASIEEMYFNNERGLDKNQFMRLAECTFIENKENLMLTGSTGIGKSYIASALGQQACAMGYRVVYVNATKLFAKLKMAKADGSYINEVARLERQQLIILDDFGIQPLDAPSRSAFMEIIEDRHEKASTLITSQVPVAKWYEIIGEKTIADAIMDRIIHNAHRIELSGESLRKKYRKKTEINEN